MIRDVPFAVEETYHLYNRGAHKRDIFTCDADRNRFLLLLHLANSSEKINIRSVLQKYKGQTFASIFEEEKPDKSLVDVLAYSLMPNHFHLVLREKSEEGITKFLRKVLTGYSMYFNIIHGHSGVLAQGACKSRHIGDESYFRYIFAYVHLNPLSLAYPHWETTGISDHAGARDFLGEYLYSSFRDYTGGHRSERNILASDDVPEFLTTQNDLDELLATCKGQTFASSVA